MPSFEIKSRIKHAPGTQTIDALHREDAIAQVVAAAAADGDEVEVFNAVEVSGGATGTTGAALGASAAGQIAGPTGGYAAG